MWTFFTSKSVKENDSFRLKFIVLSIIDNYYKETKKGPENSLRKSSGTRSKLLHTNVKSSADGLDETRHEVIFFGEVVWGLVRGAKLPVTTLIIERDRPLSKKKGWRYYIPYPHDENKKKKKTIFLSYFHIHKLWIKGEKK